MPNGSMRGKPIACDDSHPSFGVQPREIARQSKLASAIDDALQRAAQATVEPILPYNYSLKRTAVGELRYPHATRGDFGAFGDYETSISERAAAPFCERRRRRRREVRTAVRLTSEISVVAEGRSAERLALR